MSCIDEEISIRKCDTILVEQVSIWRGKTKLTLFALVENDKIASDLLVDVSMDGVVRKDPSQS